MFFLTMGKSFEVGYKVTAGSYLAHYTWLITPRVKNSEDKMRVTLKASVDYKNQFVKSLQKLMGWYVFVPRYERSLKNLASYLDVRTNFFEIEFIDNF